jgi:Fe-S cluster assembly protein SufD
MILKSGTFTWKVKPNANLTVLKICEESQGSINASLHFELGDGSSVTVCPIILAQGNVVLNLTAILGELAHIRIAGAYVLSGQQRCIITTKQEHRGFSSKSSLIMNGIVAKRAQVEYQGSIKIGSQANQSRASQENKTILIGSQAKAISSPSLEVLTHEVQCAHGSAVGPLQSDQIYYVQSRGFSEQEAKQLLIRSFLAQAIMDIPEEKERKLILERLMTKVIANL